MNLQEVASKTSGSATWKKLADAELGVFAVTVEYPNEGERLVYLHNDEIRADTIYNQEKDPLVP